MSPEAIGPLKRALLVTTAQSVRASLLRQALEWPDLRKQLSDGRREFTQMAPGPTYVHQRPASPRRTARQVLSKDARIAPRI
ncbi:hypothetical protein [Streptomyces sp. NBC_01239]|uniref:hypothetical protein n=1 Tax=Streptomyces sp. NBC_01239 TaxID=2903792 RepID=UPI002B1D2D25|nr:hypothetical protein [Streptomyces sp. NBC_01239]